MPREYIEIFGKMSLGLCSPQVQVFWLAHLSIHPAVLHTQLRLNTAKKRMIKERSLKTFKQTVLFRLSRSVGRESTFTIFFVFRDLKIFYDL
jgi:hypothetical protein